MWDIVTIGFASFGLLIANSLAVVAINLNLGAYGGDTAISAYGIIGRIRMFAIMPGIVIGHGMQPILGYNYGAKRFGRAIKTIKLAIIAATVICAFGFILLFFLPEPFIRIFTTDAEIIDLGVYAAQRVFFFLYLLGFVFVSWTVFQALGKVVKSFVASISRSALFLIPLVYILPRYMGLDGIWLAFPVSDLATYLVTLAFFAVQMRQLRKARRLAKRKADEAYDEKDGIIGSQV